MRDPRWNWKWVLLLVAIAIAAGWWLSRPTRVRVRPAAPVPAASPTRPEPLPQDPAVRFFANGSEASEYTEPYREQRREGDDLESAIVAAIAEAETSVEVAVQELQLPRIAAALVDRHRAGVRVRVVLEHDYARPWSSYRPADLAALPDRDRGKIEDYFRLGDRDRDGRVTAEEILQTDALVMLDRAGVPRLDDRADGSAGSGLMHHKFAIVDGQTVVSGSANWTPSGIHGDFARPESRGNANHLLRIESPDLAAQFREEFELMWGDGPGGAPDSRFGLQKPARPPRTFPVGGGTVTVQFAPQSDTKPWEASPNGTLATVLARTAETADLALFVFSDQRLADALGDRRQAGVRVRALIDPQFAYRDYSEGLDLLGAVLPGDDCEPEPGNRPWTPGLETVGVPDLPDGDVLHHKMAVLDGKIAISGSHNWSAAANHRNDEALLIVENPTVAAHFQREFDRLYRDAFLGISPRLQERLDAARDRCGLP